MAGNSQRHGISGNSASGFTFTGNVSGALDDRPGKKLYVDTTAGSSGVGTSWASAFVTMQEAITAATDHSVIRFRGKVREQIVAPLGIQGVAIVGCVGGNVRDDDGAKWYTPASPVAGKALIEIREQGWEFHNFLMTPDTTSGACIKAHRNEDATYPDSSHFVCRKMRFVGTSLTTTYGIDDVGGNHHYLVDDCEFQTLTTGIRCASTAIAVPIRNTIKNSKFLGNTNDIVSPMTYSLLEGNRHFTDNTLTVDIHAGAGNNIVTGCVFPNANADIDPAHGYDGEAGDFWVGNFCSDQAAFTFGNPA